MSEKLKFAISLCLPLLLAGLLALPLLADDDEENEGSSEAAAEAVAAMPDSVLDSIYAVINKEYQADVQPIFKRSCYDCHSTETHYPWYHSLPLIKQMMDDHVEEGREHLDMTNGFPFKGEDSQRELLENIKKEIEKGDMPLFSYRLMHWGLMIDGTRRDTVFKWIDGSLKLLGEQ